MDAYKNIENISKRLSHLSHAQAILGWDEAVMMPGGGGDARAEALAELSVMVHETYARPELKDWIARAEEQLSKAGDTPESRWKKANLHEFKRGWLAAICLPAEFVEKKTLACLRSEQAWRGLRHKNDWASYRPFLEEVVRLTREESRLRAAASGLKPYDAMMDLYDPGNRTETLDRVFGDLKKFLPDFIRAVVDRQKQDKVTRLEGPFPIENQRKLGLEMMEKVGFDFAHGRLDVSHHPFCGGVPRDVRITTRYNDDDFAQSFMGVLHETGHAKYEQGLCSMQGASPDRSRITQPAAQSRGMGMHESQSLFMEMQVARSREFLEFAAPIMRRHFDVADGTPGWDPTNLYRLYTRVRPDYIRVDADEVTYPAHIILRYELEKALLAGDLEVKELPAIWDAKMREVLGLSTKGNDKDGCMQDVHWPAGLIGYFPSYSLGAMIAAQLMAALRKERPSLGAEIARGEFGPMNDWLSAKVWSRGSQLPTQELLREATGEALNPAHFEAHLKRRYLEG